MTAARRARLIAFAIEAATYLGCGRVTPTPAAPTPAAPTRGVMPRPVAVAVLSCSSPDPSPAGHPR